MHITSGLLPGQVLQRQGKHASATLAGSCTAAGPVSATISAGTKPLPRWKSRKIGTAADGAFIARLDGIPVGGPYAVTLTAGREKLTVREIFVGDVWLMAGQSNMEGVGNLSEAARPHQLIRSFSMARRWGKAVEPLHHRDESPDPCHNPTGITPEQAARSRAAKTKGTGVGVYFARLMLERSGVPQGLICTAHGGTSMEQWDPAKAAQGGESMYGSMLLSVRACAQPVAGVLWYQGCSETDGPRSQVYSERMIALVAAFRRDLGQPKLPVLSVQIGRVVAPWAIPRWWNDIQEQQRLLPEVIPHFATVPAIDLGLDDLIHISGASFPVLADRLARVADRLVLGNRKEQPPIALKSVKARVRKPTSSAPVWDMAIGMRTPADVVTGWEVEFAHVVGGLRAAGLPRGFAAVDAELRPVACMYKTVLDGNKAIIEATDAAHTGLALMYGQGCDPVCTISDGRGMGLPVFGPVWPAGALTYGDFATAWRASAIQSEGDIARLTRPEAGNAEVRKWSGAFINEHERWQHADGHASFHGVLEIPEAMELELRFGYDGPIRCWVGSDEILTDLAGTNPAVADARIVRLKLPAGRLPVTVLMGLNGGKAWGFFLRPTRRIPAKLERGVPAMPRFSAA